MQRLILIWGILIGLYLIVANRAGATAGFQGVTSLIVGTTKGLQGR
jgi:hypothetical protein